MTKNKGCSLAPQNIIDTVWYYENPGSIQFYIDPQLMRASLNEGHGISFRIMKRKLKQSLKRMDSDKRSK
jgi:hypothetical protein